VTLTEKHFVGPLSVQTRTSARDRVNSVKGVYVSETNNWQVSDFPTISSATYVTNDNNTRYYRDVVLPFTTSSSCAQRLAVIELRRAREEITFTARFRLEAMQVRAGDTVMITNAKLGWSSKVFEVMEWNFASEGTPPQLFVDMTLRETASSVYSWTVSDEIAVPDSPNTTLPDPFTLAAPTALVLTADGTTEFIQVDGTVIPRIKVKWTPPAEEFIQSGGSVVIEYKPSASTTYLTWAKVGGDQAEDYISSDVVVGTNYNVRLFGESYFGVSTTYVEGSITVAASTTANAVPTGYGLTNVGVTPKLVESTREYYFGSRAYWIPNTERNFDHYEIKATATNSSSAIDYAWFGESGVSGLISTKATTMCLYSALPTFGFTFLRSVNRSGVASAWIYLGLCASNSSYGVGSISSQDSTNVTIGSTTGAGGVKTGSTSASSVRQVAAIYQVSHVATLSGGSPTETFAVSLANRGFTTKPDVGVGGCVNADLLTTYDYDHVSNSSSTAYVRASTLDGSNIGAGNYRFNLDFTEYN
jgi:hypothetical protein